MSEYEQRARHLLAQASMMPEAKAMNLDPRTSHGKPDSGLGPTGESFGLYDAIARRVQRANGPTSLREAVEWGEEQVRAVQYSRRPKLDLTLRENRLLLGSDPRTAKVVAQVYNLPISTVYRWRNEARKLDALLDAA